MKDKRFELTLEMRVTETKESGEQQFFDSDVNYHDLPYDGVVAVQRVFIEALEKLNDLGIAAAGESEVLAALLGEKHKGKK